MPDLDRLYDEAISLQEGDRPEEAVAKLEELLGQDPNHGLAHCALSVLYGKLERHDDAVVHAQKVCELEPEDPFSFVALSLVCQKAGRLMEAEEATMQARRLQMSGE
jgi:Flp pilus assembly protein TadD